MSKPITPLILAIALALACPSLALAQAPAASDRTPEEQAMVVTFSKQMKQSMGRTPSEAEIDGFLQQMRAMSGNIMAGVMALKQASNGQGMPPTLGSVAQMPAAVEAAAPASMSEEAFRAAIAALATTGDFVVFGSSPDGFTVNGAPYLDPDGAILDHGADGRTGMVTYVVDTGRDSALVKITNARGAMPPLLAGRLTHSQGRVAFTSVTGATAGGNAVIPSSQGLVITRGSSFVVHDWLQAPRAKPVPAGFAVAHFQNGDVGGTRTLLLERDAETNKLKAELHSFKSIIGSKSISDYSLLNIDTGQTIALNFSRERNLDNFYTPDELHRRNRPLYGSDRRNALYGQDGRPNHNHYYWAIVRQNTAQGPVAVVKEAGLREINVIRLSDGARFNAFSRGMGIEFFATALQPDGDLEIAANWAFKAHPVLLSEVLTRAPAKE